MRLPSDSVSATRLDPISDLSERDVREGGRWTRRQRFKNALLRQIVRLGLWLGDRLPPGWLVGILGWVGALTHTLSSTLRTRTRRALERASLPRELAPAVWRNCGRNLGRCLLLRRDGAITDWVEVDAESERCLEGAIAEGRGVVFVSLHLGPFEWLAARIAALWEASGRGAPGPAIVVRESYDPRLDPPVDAHRVDRGLEVIHRGKAGASARILRSLKQGRPVGFLPDLGGRVRSVAVRWLGGTTEFPLGPVRIAQRTGARLLVGYLEPRAGGRFGLCISSSEALAAEDPTQALADELQQVILRHPEHWLWMAQRSSR